MQAQWDQTLQSLSPVEPESTISEYQYDPLDEEHAGIRLIKICKADQDDAALYIELWHTCLEHEPSYSALSYTWDRPSDDSPAEWNDPKSLKYVLVNHKRFGVRQNLFHALAAMRTKWADEKVWWIDAICINQNDIEERNAQVKRMHDVYSRARATCVWLGPPDNMIPIAFKKITQVAESWRQRSEPLQDFEVPDEFVAQYADIVSKEFGDEDPTRVWECIRAVLTRSWWTRAWVVQEVCASSLTVLFSGPYVIGWSHLSYLFLAVAQHGLSFRKLKDVDVGYGRQFMPLLLETSSAFTDIDDLLQTYQALRKDGKMPPLHAVLQRLRNRSAADPKDKVFAGLGLAKEGHVFNVDYRQTEQEIFTKISYHCMASTKDLTILGFCKFPPHLSTLPSWAPD